MALKHMEESDLKELGIPMVRPNEFNLRFSIHPSGGGSIGSRADTFTNICV